jgi:hypothetical protein
VFVVIPTPTQKFFAAVNSIALSWILLPSLPGDKLTGTHLAQLEVDV